jgi:hypothetical protein
MVDERKKEKIGSLLEEPPPISKMVSYLWKVRI